MASSDEQTHASETGSSTAHSNAEQPLEIQKDDKQASAPQNDAEPSVESQAMEDEVSMHDTTAPKPEAQPAETDASSTQGVNTISSESQPAASTQGINTQSSESQPAEKDTPMHDAGGPSAEAPAREDENSTHDAGGPSSQAPARENDALTMHSVAAPSLETDSSVHDDNRDSDTDSAVGSWRSARTQSLTSSVADYIYENGRRYHAFREGEYPMPNDDNEQDRLDLQHAIFCYALDDRLFRAPIATDDLHDILDVGCGTGLWCIDAADHNPQAQVLGFDLRHVPSQIIPIQPDMVPPNCKFLVDDCNAEWLFAERFDLIHTRAMTPGVKDWPRYLQQAYQHLKPGGYIELHEINMPASCTKASLEPETPFFIQWSEHAYSAGSKVGFVLGLPKQLDSLLQAAGFVDIDIHWQNWPVGPWAKGAKNKHIGRWFAEDLKNATSNSAAMFTRVLGWKQEEFEVFAAKIANEIDEGKKHMWLEICFAHARKPLHV